MTKKYKDISDEETMDLIRLISKPSLEYIIKRIQKTHNKIIQENKYPEMTVNSFLSIVICSLSVINSQSLKWLSTTTSEKTGESIDMELLRSALIKGINDRLGKNVEV